MNKNILGHEFFFISDKYKRMPSKKTGTSKSKSKPSKKTQSSRTKSKTVSAASPKMSKKMKTAIYAAATLAATATAAGMGLAVHRYKTPSTLQSPEDNK